jgi:hypothetical protein
VIHLIDTDGVFIEDNYIFEDFSRKKIFYLENKGMETNLVSNTIKRNSKKRQLINILCSSNIINGMDYKMYYFSCNL